MRQADLGQGRGHGPHLRRDLWDRLGREDARDGQGDAGQHLLARHHRDAALGVDHRVGRPGHFLRRAAHYGQVVGIVGVGGGVRAPVQAKTPHDAETPLPRVCVAVHHGDPGHVRGQLHLSTPHRQPGGPLAHQGRVGHTVDHMDGGFAFHHGRRDAEVRRRLAGQGNRVRQVHQGIVLRRRPKATTVRSHDLTIRQNQRRVELLDGGGEHHVRGPARRDRTPVPETQPSSWAPGGRAQGPHGIHAQGNGPPQHLVQVTGFQEVVRGHVVGDQTDAHVQGQGFQRGDDLPAQVALLELEGDAQPGLRHQVRRCGQGVVRVHARGDERVQGSAPQHGVVALDDAGAVHPLAVEPTRRLQDGPQPRVTGEDGRTVHDLGEAKHVRLPQKRSHVRRADGAAGSFQARRRGHARADQVFHLQGDPRRRGHHGPYAGHAQDVGDLVGVLGHGGDAQRQNRLGEMGRGHQGALDVQVAVHQAGNSQPSLPVDDFPGLATGLSSRWLHRRDLAVVDDDVRGVDLTGDDVGQPDIGQQQIGGFLVQGHFDEGHGGS